MKVFHQSWSDRLQIDHSCVCPFFSIDKFIIILIDVFDKFEDLRIKVKQMPYKWMEKIVNVFVIEFIQGEKLELF